MITKIILEWVLILNLYMIKKKRKKEKSEGKLLFNSFPLLYKLSNNHEM